MDNFFAQRLKSLRINRGWTLEKLAEKLHHRVTKQAISKYEQAKMLPESSVLEAIATVFGVEIDYFSKPIAIDWDELSFRPNHYLGKREQSLLKSIVIEQIEPYVELEQLLQINSEFFNPLLDFEVWQPSDLEKAVIALRNHWQVGNEPIPNVRELLERNGVKIVEVYNSVISVDAILLHISHKIPIIAVDASRGVIEQRMAMLRELGFLLFPRYVETSDRLCHYFASAFLLPKTTFQEVIGAQRKHLVIQEILRIKERFGITEVAIIERGAIIGLFPLALSNRLKKYLAHHQRDLSVEKVEFSGKERSYRFNQLLCRAIAENILTLDKAADLTNTPPEKLQKTLNLL